jgi:signal transduction histidine kinase
MKLVTVQEEITKLRDIADEAYRGVRDTLESLELERSQNLGDSMCDYANLIAKRANFELTFTSKGPQQSLPPVEYNQVFLIFRETLANIEFHAQATQVSVRLDWSLDRAVLTVRDDGAGFDTVQSPPNNHFGLRIMQERASQINGQLSIQSAPGEGTQVSLIFPLNSANVLKNSAAFRLFNAYEINRPVNFYESADR